MSEEREYDHALRLLEIKEMYTGVGKTLEESRASVAAKKRSLVPSVKMVPAEGATVEEADAELVSLFEDIFVACAQIRGVLESLPEGTWPPAFRDLVLTHLFEVLSTADVPWQALAPNAARMTLAGRLAKLTREGKTVTGIRFGERRAEEK